MGGKQFVVVDGLPGSEYDGIAEGGLVFSPDGKRIAYGAKNGNKWFVVIDGKPGPEYDDIVQREPTFQPDGSFAYLAERSGRLYRVKQ